MKLPALALGLLLGLSCGAARAEEHVTFPSLTGTQIDGYLFRPLPESGRHPAIVFLHGCGGLLGRSGAIERRERDWAARFNATGTAVLMVDSFSARGVHSMCAPKDMQPEVYLARPKDAYGALAYLQAQDFVVPDRIGLIGWSEGGGTVLFAIRDPSLGRPAVLPHGDFKAAVAFYPASCAANRNRLPWMSGIPLLVLIGAEDVWTPAPPCQAMIDDAARRGAPASIRVYPESYHDFDWPGMQQHEVPAFRTKSGVVPIEGTNEAARNDALMRVPAFLDQYLGN